MTNSVAKADQAINTIDIFALETHQPSNNILDFNDNETDDLNANQLNNQQ